MPAERVSARSCRRPRPHAALEQALERAQQRVVPAYHAERDWRDAIRAALHELLIFLETDRAAAELLLVDSLSAGRAALAQRARVVDALTDAVDAGRATARAPAALSGSTAEAIVGGVLAILHARIAQRDERPLTLLAGELMGVILTPYLGPVAAARERRRPNPVPARRLNADPSPLQGVSVRLTYRTLLVLRAIAAKPGASNRQIAQLADIADAGQASKLLARLQHHGLIENTRPRRAKGAPNAWKLTRAGAQVEWATR